MSFNWMSIQSEHQQKQYKVVVGVVGKIAGAVVALFVMTYMLLLSSCYFLHQAVQQRVSELNYSVCETVAVSGELSSQLYQYLRDSLRRFGDYRVKLRLEKQVETGVYDTYFDEARILDVKLRVGDRLTVYLEDRVETLFGRLINASIFGSSPQRAVDVKIRSIKTALVSKDGRDLADGRQVVADIQARAGNPAVAVHVSTRKNPGGRYYGSESHPDVPFTNLFYDDEEAGDDRIDEESVFIRETEYYDNGQVRLVRYIQR